MHWAQMFPNVGLSWDELSFLRDNWDGRSCSRGSPRSTTPSSRPRTVSTASSCRTTAAPGRRRDRVAGRVARDRRGGGRATDRAVRLGCSHRRGRGEGARPRREGGAARAAAAVRSRAGRSGGCRACTAVFPGRARPHLALSGYANHRELNRDSLVQAREAVVFDLDNTLFDHRVVDRRAPRLGCGLGGTASDELVAQWFVIEERNFNQWLSGTVTHQGQRRGRLRDFLPCSAIRFRRSTRNSIQVYTGYLRHYQASWAAYPDARPALEVARSNRWRVSVLTNGSTKQQNAKLAAIEARRPGRRGLHLGVSRRRQAGPAGLSTDLRRARRRAG